jgi:hypothetical protein
MAVKSFIALTPDDISGRGSLQPRRERGDDDGRNDFVLRFNFPLEQRLRQLRELVVDISGRANVRQDGLASML